MRRIIFAILFSICMCSSAIAIQVSGDVWGVWSADDNPYEVTGDLRVPQESTLVIEPGCYIDFQGHYMFLVDTSAVFEAVGTESDSITFTASDTIDGWYGLRFFNASSSCEVSYCIIKWGRTPGFGEPSISNGGGIFISNSSINISHCSLSNNEAYEGEGGGIYCEYSNIVLFANAIISNKSSFGGAGICCINSIVNITNNVFECNITFYPLGGGFGGAISCNSSNVIISSNKFYQNGANYGGGGIVILRGTALIEYNIFDENSSWTYGGAIHIVRATFRLKGNLIINNYFSFFGGGLSCSSDTGSMIIENNTFYGNSARGRGGAIYITFDENDTLLNNIIYGNTAYDEDNICVHDIEDSMQIFYCNIEGGWPGEGNIDADPLFIDPDAGDFHLSWANYPIDDETKSPCIDAGAPWSPYDPDSTRADMGALPFDQSINNIDIEDIIPKSINLSQNYPNPFNTSTAISYTLPCQSDVTIDIYDILGRKVETLVSRHQPAGYHRVIWDAEGLSSGMYFYKIQAGDYLGTKKMVLLR